MTQRQNQTPLRPPAKKTMIETKVPCWIKLSASARTRRKTASVTLLVSIVVAVASLSLLSSSSTKSLWGLQRITGLPFHDNNHKIQGTSKRKQKIFGEDLLAELNDRATRFPSVGDRVRLYMSDWFLPPCNSTNSVLYKTIRSQVAMREVLVDFSGTNRVLLLDESTTLRKIHVMNRSMMDPVICSSEYCQDVLEFWFPAVDRVDVDTIVPFLFQFSDEEVSLAFEPATKRNVTYPNLPHMKKMRLSITTGALNFGENQCSDQPRSSTPPLDQEFADLLPKHLNPIIFKLKTNRHYGMLSRISSQDTRWDEKKNQAIFRGTLTGFLPPNSGFSVSTRSSNASILAGDEAKKKCHELDRCRLVYQVDRFYSNHLATTRIVDAKLVPPKLQHVDMPLTIGSVELFGNRMTKQAILKYKAIVILEGNDVGTGLKWALFSNSVVLAPAIPRFTSWAMEELLVPWHHFIPLNMSNLYEDVHYKMQWIIDHDAEAQQIAKQGSLWIRDLWIHPDAVKDDREITQEMVRRYAAHFQHAPELMIP